MKIMNQRSDLVISVGTLPDLVSLREAVLKKAGFRVVNAFNEAEALAKIYSGDCGVLLLCYSMEDESRNRSQKRFVRSAPKVALF
jgi:DNA-binding response OmpR family regulator